MIEKNCRLFFVGNLVPDEKKYHTIAFSRAGNMCQCFLLAGLKQFGIKIDQISSFLPVPSYPTAKKIFFSGGKASLDRDTNIDFLPFINITPLKQFTIGLATLYQILKWAFTVGSKTPKLILSYNISVPPGVFTVFAAKLTGAKIVAMVYDIFVPGQTAPRSCACLFDYWLHKNTLPKYDGLIVITEAISRDFAPNIPSLRIEGGIKPDLVEQYLNINFQDYKDAGFFTIVATGGLVEVNGIREILSAFAMLPGERYRLFIAGDGPLTPLVREAATLDKRISYFGLILFEDVIELYAKADVLINMRLTQRLDSRYFFPSKIMEYLASGVPVISTCPSNMVEEYGNYAYLLIDESPESLVKMILDVEQIPEEDRRKMGVASQQYMAKNKTWNAQAEKIGTFLSRISETTSE